MDSVESETLHPTRAMAVANWFIEKNSTDPQATPLDQMKLYKLVYYAHAWYVGNTSRELFPEDIEAWPHGPVVRDLYGKFCKFGRNQINSLGTRLEIKNGKVSRVTPRHDGNLDHYFKIIWDTYKGYSGVQLSNMTHAQNEPWTKVAEQYDYNLSSKPTITTEIIGDCFANRIQQSN